MLLVHLCHVWLDANCKDKNEDVEIEGKLFNLSVIFFAIFNL